MVYNPPSSTRYCMVCDKFRTFNYNRKFGHSECFSCSARYGVRRENPVLIHFLEKIKEMKDYNNIKEENKILKKMVEKYKKKDDNQKIMIQGLKSCISKLKEKYEK